MKIMNLDPTEELARVRAEIAAQSERHDDIGRRFNIHVSGLRKQCDEKLARLNFAPYTQIQKAGSKAQVAQAECINRIRKLEGQVELLERLAKDAAPPAPATPASDAAPEDAKADGFQPEPAPVAEPAAGAGEDAPVGVEEFVP